MGKRKRIVNKIVRQKKERSDYWVIITFSFLFVLAVVPFIASSRHSYMLGETLGTCDPYGVCPTSTSTPSPSATIAPSTTVSPTTAISPSVSPSVSPSISPSVVPSVSPINQPQNNVTDDVDNPTVPSSVSPLISNPTAIDLFTDPVNSFQSLISDPETGEVTGASLIGAPVQLVGNSMDAINSAIDSWASNLVHVEGPRMNKWQIPAGVCRLLDEVGMEWICE